MKYIICALGLTLSTYSWAAVEDFGQLIQETERNEKTLKKALKMITEDSTAALNNAAPSSEVTVAEIQIELRPEK